MITTAKPKRARRIFVLAIAMLAAVVAVELGARAWLALRGDPYDSARTRREALDLRAASAAATPGSHEDRGPKSAPRAEDGEVRVLHPYLGWEVGNGSRQLEEELARERAGRPKGELQVLVVGGSVAADFALDTLGWPKLSQLVLADPRLAGRTLRALDFGRAGFKEPQQLNFVLYLLGSGLAPDAVLDIDGFDETALASSNAAAGEHPSYPSAQHWTRFAAWSTSDRFALDRMCDIRERQRSLESWGDWFSKWHVDTSCVLGRFALRRMYEQQRAIAAQSESYVRYLSKSRNLVALHGPSLAGGAREAVEANVECWRECSRSLADICRARGIPYVQVLQPTLHDAGSKPLSAREIEAGRGDESSVSGVRLGYPRLREEGEALKRLGVDFIDASMIFERRTDDLYSDCCRFERQGHELLAERIAPELRRVLAEKR